MTAPRAGRANPYGFGGHTHSKGGDKGLSSICQSEIFVGKMGEIRETALPYSFNSRS